MIEDIKELEGCADPQEVVDVLTTLLEDQAYVGLVEQAFFAEVSLLDGLPDLFALASAADKWPGLLHQLQSLVSWHVSQTGEGLGDTTGHADGVASLSSARHACVVCLVD